MDSSLGEIADVESNAKRTAPTTTIHADELQPGDIVVFGGQHRQIARVDRRAGWSWPIAADDTGWAIALDHDLIDIHRTAPCDRRLAASARRA